MAPEDSKAPFLRIPWTARLLNRPDIITFTPEIRRVKPATKEDSLLAETLKTPRAIRSVVCFYRKPTKPQPPSSSSSSSSSPSLEDPNARPINSVSMLVTLGDGVNGHPEILHGGITAVLLDEAMGILQSVNRRQVHLQRVGEGQAQGELPPHGMASFTADLRVRFLKPIRTPGALVCTAWYDRAEGRKSWIRGEIRQQVDATEDDDGVEVVCATGEALFIGRRGSTL